MKFEELVEQYNGDIINLALKYSRVSKINDFQDFYSVGLIGFYKAFQCYDTSYNTSIRTVAYTYCKNEMYNMVRAEFGKKKQANIVHIEAFEEPANVCGGFYDEYDIYSKDLLETLKLVSTILTKKQYEIFYSLIMLGKSPTEIAKDRGVSLQAIQQSVNASIYKIRKSDNIMGTISALA